MRRLFRIRNLIIALSSGLLLLGVLLVTYRLWLPAVLPPILKPFGVDVDAIRWVSADAKEGAGFFKAVNVRYLDESMRISADWIELPGVWTYWQSRGQVQAGDIQVTLLSAEDPITGEAAVVSPQATWEMVQRLVTDLQAWLPEVRVDRLGLQLAGGDSYFVELRNWDHREGTGSLDIQFAAWPEVVQAQYDLTSATAYRVDVDSPEQALSLVAELSANENGNPRLQYSLKQPNAEIIGSLAWNHSAWIPSQADVSTSAFPIQPAWLSRTPLPALNDLMLQALNIHWDGLSYKAEVTLNGTYADASIEREELSASFLVEGDWSVLKLEQLALRFAWADIELSQPVTIDLQSGEVDGEARLDATIDLAKQTYVDATGEVSIRASIDHLSMQEGLGQIQWTARADALHYQDYGVSEFSASGSLLGLVMQIDELGLSFDAATPTSHVTGQIDFGQAQLNLRHDVTLSAEWLKALELSVDFQAPLTAKGTLSGTFEVPRVETELQARFQVDGLEAIDLVGELTTQGFQQMTWAGAVRSSGAGIESSLQVDRLESAWKVSLEQLVWSDPERPELRLQAPMQATWLEAGGVSSGWESRLRVTPFRLMGDDLSLSGRFDPEVKDGIQLSMQNLSMVRVNRWLTNDLPEYRIQNVDLALAALRPYLSGGLTMQLVELIPGGSQLGLELRAKFTDAGIELPEVHLRMDADDLLAGHATLPVRLGLAVEADSTAYWKLLEKAPLTGQLSGEMSAAFSQWLIDQYGVRFSLGTVEGQLSGTLDAPEGYLQFKVEDVGMVGSSDTAEMPVVDRVEVKLTATPSSLSLDPLSIQMRAASIRGSLHIPVSAFSEALEASGSAVNWKQLFAQASGNLELAGWEMENWVDFMPDVMRRTGKLNGHVELAKGGKASGRLKFEGFALRPTSTMPSVNSIGGDLLLKDNQLTLSQGLAKIGGHPVDFKGYINTEDYQHPSWQIEIKGENVPIVRTSEMILRSDLDIIAKTSPDKTPSVEGKLNLRASTLLLEIDPFAPNFEQGASQKPPYFSISEPAFADWRFNLEIRGNDFMRVRSAYIKALLSADFHLGGTFAYPELIGVVRTKDTLLRFPGATMRLNEGEAYIAQGQPDVVQLNFTGTAQKSGHVITMEVDETLSEPHIQFQSTPELSNAEIIRLLATGSLNGGGLGSAGLYLGQGLLGTSSAGESWADRVSIDVGEETSREGKNTIDFRYELSEDWYLNGGYDRYDAYNLDLVWRIFTR